MNRLVLGVFMIGATLLLMSSGIMMIGASLLLFIISHFVFPNLRKFVPDINAVTEMLRGALQGILFDSIYEDEFKRGDDIQDDSLDEWSTTTYLRRRKEHEVQETIIPMPRDEYGLTKLYRNEPHPQTPEKPKTDHGAPHEPFHYERHPKSPSYEADKPKEPVKPAPYHYLDYLPYYCEPHHKDLENHEHLNYAPHPKSPYYETDKPKHHEKPKPVPEKPKQPERPPEPKKAPPPPSRKPNEFVDTYNKIKTFDVTDQTGDSD